MELRRNRGAAVATPAWEDARDTFDVRLGLERLVMSRLASRLTPERIRALEAHVNEEEKALAERAAIDPARDRVHILLAEMTGRGAGALRR